MNLRAQIETEIAGAVDEHERIRAALQKIDAMSPSAGDFTLEVRHALMAINHRYTAMRLLLAKETLLGELEPATRLPSLAQTELFARVPSVMTEGERERMLRTMHRVGDHSLDAEDTHDHNVMVEEKEVPRG